MKRQFTQKETQSLKFRKIVSETTKDTNREYCFSHAILIRILSKNP